MPSNAKKTGYLMWSIAVLFYIYQFVLRVTPVVIVDELLIEFSAFSLNKAALGHLSALYFYAYAFTLLPAGFLYDRWDPRICLSLACLLTTLSTFMFGYSPTIGVASLSRCFMGSGSAFAFIGCLTIARQWLPLKHFPLFVGITNACGMLGPIIGNHPFARLVDLISWRHSFYLLGLIGLIITLLLILFISDNPKIANQKQAIQKLSILGIRSVITHPATLLLACYSCLLVAPIIAFGELWGNIFFQCRLNIPKADASALISTIFMGIAFGGPCIGYLASKIKVYYLMSISSLIALVCLLITLYYDPLSVTQIRVLLFVYGFFTTNMLLSFSLISAQHPAEHNGIAIAFTNMVIMAVGAAFQPIVGKLLDLSQSYHAAGTPLLLSDFRSAFLILPLGLIVALILLQIRQQTMVRD